MDYPLSAKIPHAETSAFARRFSRDLPVGNRLCLNGLFEQAAENQAARIGRSSIEAKDELVEVMV